MVNNDAVSPVVGVMLMLVVTIIIAAIVSAFGGGLIEDTKKAPNAQIRYVGATWDVDGSNTVAPGLVFEHAGGDTVDLSTLQIDLRGGLAICLITYNDPPSKRNELNENRARPDVRMEKYGAGLSKSERKNTRLNAGERFIIYGEVYPADAPSSLKQSPLMAFRSDRNDNPNAGNAYSSGLFGVAGGGTEYVLSDLESGKILAQGYTVGEI